MSHHYSFKDCLARAERINWRVEDLIGGDKSLDFSKPFLPESLARTAGLLAHLAEEREQPVGFLMASKAEEAIAYERGPEAAG